MTPSDWTNWGDATNVVRVIGLLIPIITGVVTSKLATSAFKSVVTLALSVLTAALAVLVAPDGHGFAWAAFLNAFVNAFIPAIAVYYGFLKPSGTSAKVASLTSGFGIGKPAPVVVGGDAGYGTLGTLGSVLVMLALVLLVLVLLKAIAISLVAVLVIGVIGLLLVFASGRSTL